MTSIQLVEAAAIGLAAGVLGGMAGIGGSMIMLPGLALVFGYHDRAHTDQHVYMAAAMAVNVLVAVPATRRHAKAGALRHDLVKPVMPAMIAAIILGVLVSNWMDGRVLKYLLALFIAGYCLLNIYRIFRPRTDATRPAERRGAPILATVGGVAGFIGGLLGLGGGVVMVPMLQVLGNIRLREAIATSSAVMVASALIGAALKFATLHIAAPGHLWTKPALLVVAMAPGAIIGGTVGAALAHKLPLRAVRGIVSVILLVAAIRLGLSK